MYTQLYRKSSVVTCISLSTLCAITFPKNVFAQTDFSGENNKGQIVKTETLPTPDGQMEAIWDRAVKHPIDNSVDPNKPSDEADALGYWKALWTPTHLYLFVSVQDDKKMSDSPGHSYQDDQIELFVTSDNNKPASYFSPRTTNTFAYENPRVGPSIETHKGTKGFKAGYAEVTGGWNFEISIPFSDWKINPKSGDWLGMEVQINDDDDGGQRDHKLSWNSLKDGAAFNPRMQGSSQFVNDPPITAILASKSKENRMRLQASQAALLPGRLVDGRMIPSKSIRLR